MGSIKTHILWLGLILLSMTQPSSSEDGRTVDAMKKDILDLAARFLGQGDPDFSKQRQLQGLVDKLLAAAPQPPVKDRLELLSGVWKQVWGPYDYRRNDRGVDPKVTVDEIYQVVFPDGYYYNVAPFKNRKDPDGVRINLLRGEYKLVDDLPNMLRVRFTKFTGYRGRPKDRHIWALPALSEREELEDEVTIVPRLIVRLFFGGGGLREVYTDKTMRILYGGSSLTNRSKEAIYIMTRVE